MATGGDRLEALVLAAGLSRRFGAPKLLADFGGRPLIEAALDVAFSAPVRGVTVVTGGHGKAVSAAVQAYGRATGRTVRLVSADDHALGLSASLKAGVRALPADTSGVFVFLADMPWIPGGIAGRLAGSLGEAPAAAPAFKGRRGHPVLLSARLFPDIAGLDGDHGAGHILRRLGEALVLVETDGAGVQGDVAHPADLP